MFTQRFVYDCGARLGALTDLLKGTGAKLVYATMTPFMPEKYLNPPGPAQSQSTCSMFGPRMPPCNVCHPLLARVWLLYSQCGVCATPCWRVLNSCIPNAACVPPLVGVFGSCIPNAAFVPPLFRACWTLVFPLQHMCHPVLARVLPMYTLCMCMYMAPNSPCVCVCVCACVW